MDGRLYVVSSLLRCSRSADDSGMTSIAAAKFDDVGFATTASNARIASSAPALLPDPPSSRSLAVRPFAYRLRSVPGVKDAVAAVADSAGSNSHSAYAAGSVATTLPRLLAMNFPATSCGHALLVTGMRRRKRTAGDPQHVRRQA